MSGLIWLLRAIALGTWRLIFPPKRHCGLCGQLRHLEPSGFCEDCDYIERLAE